MKIRYIVHCTKHGNESKDWAGKQVVVPQPLTKKIRKDGGCPLCIQDRLKEKDA